MLLNQRTLEHLKEKWWKNNPNRATCEIQENQSDGISIQNIGGVFIVIFVGIGLALITLAFEYWWYKCRKTSRVIAVEEADCRRPESRVQERESQIEYIRDPNQISPENSTKLY